MADADTCVIYNPAAGRGRAGRRLESLRQTLGQHAEFRPTQAAGHAEQLALEAAQAGFAVVGAAGGDGTVHEVANGLLRADSPEVALAVYPVGSANDYAHSLGLNSTWWLAASLTPSFRAVDVGRVRSPGGRERFFVNGLGLGFNAAVTLEARRIRYLQGLALYGAALLRALCFHFASPTMTLTLDQETREVPTLALTVAIGRREGNFVVAPDAIVDDGLFDYLHAGALARWQLLRYVPGMITGRLPTDDPEIRSGRCRAVRISAREPVAAHVDGEFFCKPEDQVRSLEIDLLPGALRVQVPR